VPTSLQTAVNNGNSLARIRPTSSQGSVIYKRHAFADWDLVAVASWNSERGGYQEAANTLFLGSYTVYNSRIALQNRHWRVAFKAQNVMDTDFYVNQAGSPNNGIGATYVPGRQRYIEGSIGYRW